MQKNFYANPTGRINSSDECDLEVDDLGYIRPGQNARQMFSDKGFEPTEQQLEAMNSGITKEKVAQIQTNKEDIADLNTDIGNVENDILTIQGKTVGMDAGGSNYISVNGVKLYFGSTTPSNPSDGDWWLN